jgi:hypothetical protein
MKNASLLLITLLVSASSFAAPGRPGVREVLQEREKKKVELTIYNGVKDAAARILSLNNRLGEISAGLIARGSLSGLLKNSEAARITAERLVRADETMKTLDPKKFADGEYDAMMADIKTNVEFLSLGNRLTADVPGTINSQKAALLKMLEMDILNMAKEERAAVVKVMRQAVEARTTSNMEGDVALAKVVSLEKLKELVNCKI